MLDQVPLQLDREGIKEREDGERGVGAYSREAIISNISTKEGRLIEGRLLLEEIRYTDNTIDVPPSNMNGIL